MTRSVAFILKHNQNLEWVEAVASRSTVSEPTGVSDDSQGSVMVRAVQRLWPSQVVRMHLTRLHPCAVHLHRPGALAGQRWRANDHRLRTQWAAIKVFMITAHAVRFSTRVGCCIGPTFGVRCGV